MTINILTLFPHYFDSVLNESIIKRAIDKELVTINIVNIRDFATDKHHTTDDRPFGGGPGMVMKIEPIFSALESLQVKPGQPRSQIVLTSARGQLFDQARARNLAAQTTLTLICGHYEGVDERINQHLIDQEIRIGDYVLTGGEPAVNVILDAVIRLMPGVLGNEASNQNESHSAPGVVGHPQYTRPEIFNNWPVPPVLLSGDHRQIAQWRQDQVNK